MAIFPDDVSDIMLRILIKRNAVWANKRASQDTTATMYQHTDNTRCICEQCSDARPQPKLLHHSRAALIRSPRPDFETNGRPADVKYAFTLNPPDQWVHVDADRIPFALRLTAGPNRKPAAAACYEGTSILKKGHF